MKKPQTIRLNIDALRAVEMHQASYPNLKNFNDVINDIIIRFSTQSEVAQDDISANTMDEIIALIKEQSGFVQQVITLALRNYGLNIETASHLDPVLPNKGEQRARALLKQMDDH